MGTALVWFPVVVCFFLTGSTAKVLSCWYSMSESLTWSIMLSNRSSSEARCGWHTLLIFFGVIGGLKVFGSLGLFLGPLIIAIFQTFLTIYEVEFLDQLTIKRPATDSCDP